jgi:hypothetical protein
MGLKCANRDTAGTLGDKLVTGLVAQMAKNSCKDSESSVQVFSVRSN